MKLKKIVLGILTFVALLLFSVNAFASNTYIINGVAIHYDDVTSSPNECWEYANQIYRKIWGQRFTNAFNDNNNALRNLSDSEITLTPQHLKTYVSNAALGSVLRICNSDYLHGTDGWGHSQIIVQKDSNGFTVFQGGLSASPYRNERYYTWNEYCSTGWLGGTYSYIKYIKWPGAPAYQNSNFDDTTLPINSVSFDSGGVSNISNTNATISSWVSSSGTISEIGYYLGTSDSYQNKIVMNKVPVPWTRFYLSYNLYESYGNLSPGQTYTYVFYVVNNGVEYHSSVGHFTTNGNQIISFDTYSVSGITDTNAQTGVWFSNSTGATIEAIGFFYGIDISNLKKVETTKNVGWTRAHLLYDIGNYINEKLIPQSHYKLRYYIVVNGIMYNSDYIYFTTNKDTTLPKITNVKISDISKDGYTVTCNVFDESGIERVQFPTWTAYNGQDDLAVLNEKYGLWENAEYARGTISGNTVTYRVKTSDHNGESGTYYTDIYAYDIYGNRSKAESGTVIPKDKPHEHNYTSSVKKPATYTETGIMLYTCHICGTTRTETIPILKLETLTPGNTIKDKATNGIYKVLKDGLSVEYTKPLSKKASIRIPDEINVNGIICKVTGISAKAFKNNSSLKTVTIGKNVTKIGSNAFYGCKKLRTITIKTSMLNNNTIGAKAFIGIYSKATVKVPMEQLEVYKNLLKSKGMRSKAVYGI